MSNVLFQNHLLGALYSKALAEFRALQICHFHKAKTAVTLKADVMDK